jgi:copper(I)-binding protein
MLIGLERGLAPGETVTLTLRFDRAGPVTVQARVR